MRLEVKIKRLHSDAVIPNYSYNDDAGMDVVAITKEIEEDLIIYGTGLAFEIPKGYVMLVFPRSSISKKHLILSNSVGVIDSGYRGELIFKFRKCGENEYNLGDRIGQIMIIPYPKIEWEEVNELSRTEREESSFGGSGD